MDHVVEKFVDRPVTVEKIVEKPVAVPYVVEKPVHIPYQVGDLKKIWPDEKKFGRF